MHQMTQKKLNKKVIQSMLHDVILSAALEVLALPITKVCACFPSPVSIQSTGYLLSVITGN